MLQTGRGCVVRMSSTFQTFVLNTMRHIRVCIRDNTEQKACNKHAMQHVALVNRNDNKRI